VRLRPAEPVPDLTDAIVARARPPRPGPHQGVRWALVAVALGQLVLALPDLVLGEDGGVTLHVARHAGSLMAAMAVGLIYVAWRPERAFGLLPIASALAACMVVTAVLDSADGEAHALGELHHLLEVAGLVLVWLLAGRPRPRLPLRSRSPQRAARYGPAA
jgi:predicted anti-sigma-YlaC factor YlaD